MEIFVAAEPTRVLKQRLKTRQKEWEVIMKMNRRDFIKKGAATSFILTFSIPDKNWQAFAESSKVGLPTHYFEITKDGQYIFVMDKAEMGQGVISGQITLFCEEANIDPTKYELKPHRWMRSTLRSMACKLPVEAQVLLIVGRFFARRG